MKTREQLLRALADCKDGQEDIVILKVIESSYKDALRKKNNEAKNLRTRMLDAQMANKIVVEKYERLVDHLGLDHNKEDLARALEAISKTQKDDLVSQKNIASTTSSKEHRNMYVELEKAMLILRLNKAKAAYANALLDLIVGVTKDNENNDSLFHEDGKDLVVMKDGISAWLQLIRGLQ